MLLDVGCGPGNATQDLAKCFDSAIGLDPGRELVETASHLGLTTATGESVKFLLSAAEDIDKVAALAPGSVDLLTAAMSVSVLEAVPPADLVIP